MLFPKADIDSLVQNLDMFRIDASKSFFTGDEALTEINIYPDYGNSPLVFFNVYDELEDAECRVLDWAYNTEGVYTVRIEIKTAAISEVLDYTVESITAELDNLYSKDSQIYALENELKRYLPEGRNSWIYLHRTAQGKILDYLYRNAILNPDNSAITKDQLLAESQLSLWSMYETMLLIYQDIKTSNSIAFNEKIVDYSEARAEARQRYLIEYDSNKDGIIDEEDSAIATKMTFFTR